MPDDRLRALRHLGQQRTHPGVRQPVRDLRTMVITSAGGHAGSCRRGGCHPRRPGDRDQRDLNGPGSSSPRMTPQGPRFIARPKGTGRCCNRGVRWHPDPVRPRRHRRTHPRTGRRPADRPRTARCGHRGQQTVAAGQPFAASDVGGVPAAPPADAHVPGGGDPGPGRGVRAAVTDREERRAPFTDDDEVVVEALAGAAGIAMDNARQYGDGPTRGAWLQATAEITAQLLSGGRHRHRVAVDRHPGGRADRRGLDTDRAAHPPEPAPGMTTELTVAVSVGTAPSADPRPPHPGHRVHRRCGVHRPRPAQRPALAFDLIAGSGMQLGPALAMPLGGDDNLSGVLLAIRVSASAAFDDDESGTAGHLRRSGRAGPATRRESMDAERELEVLADRDRIARDLHEHVIGRLFGIGLALHGTQRLAKSPLLAGRIADHIDQLNERHRGGPYRSVRPAHLRLP